MKILNTDEIEKKFHVKFFFCGSQNLGKFLYEKEIVPVGSFVSNKTGKMVWRYVDCEKLQLARKEWRDKKDERYKDPNV